MHKKAEAILGFLWYLKKS